jgi:hypothetical protein
MEQENGHSGGVGCMSLLTQPFTPVPKRLIRTLKPAFGSSFNVRPGACYVLLSCALQRPSPALHAHLRYCSCVQAVAHRATCM